MKVLTPFVSADAVLCLLLALSTVVVSQECTTLIVRNGNFEDTSGPSDPNDGIPGWEINSNICSYGYETRFPFEGSRSLTMSFTGGCPLLQSIPLPPSLQMTTSCKISLCFTIGASNDDFEDFEFPIQDIEWEVSPVQPFRDGIFWLASGFGLPSNGAETAICTSRTPSRIELPFELEKDIVIALFPNAERAGMDITLDEVSNLEVCSCPTPSPTIQSSMPSQMPTSVPSNLPSEQPTLMPSTVECLECKTALQPAKDELRGAYEEITGSSDEIGAIFLGEPNLTELPIDVQGLINDCAEICKRNTNNRAIKRACEPMCFTLVRDGLKNVRRSCSIAQFCN